jgi:glutathione peroxidase
MRAISGIFMFIILIYSVYANQKQNKEDEIKIGPSFFNFVVEDIDGKPIKLSDYKGKVLLVVNVASKCGYTPQYEGLQKIYRKYKNQGFVVLGFPANNFKKQEPGTNSQIKEFCSTNFGVTFPMFSKISVKGEDIHPLYKYLTSTNTNPDFGGEISWNFNKFLLDQEGNIIARFETADKPESEKVLTAISNALKIAN